MAAVVEQVKIEIIERVKQIKTTYGYFDSSGGLTTKPGLVNIKNGVPFDGSPPAVLDLGNPLEVEKSSVRALVYDLLLCEIGLIPEGSHIDYVMSEIAALSGNSLMEKFKSYYTVHWLQIVAQEKALLDFEAKDEAENYQKTDSELLNFCDKIASKFPGIALLVALAKKTDKSIASDTGAESNNFYVRYLAQYLVDYMHDPVLGDMAYNKHAFDELVKAGQLSGLLIFKEVIKGINDNLGLASGDAVIRACFEAIRKQIPENIQQFVIFGRSQADIMIGFNTQALNKLSPPERIVAMQSINKFITYISEMSKFECILITKTGSKKFILPVGVGAAKLNPECDQKQGRLEPKEYGQCFVLAELSFDKNYIQKLLEKQELPAALQKLTSSTDSDLLLEIDPDLWNLYKYLNDPKRGHINCSRLLKNFGILIKSNQFTNMDCDKIRLLFCTIKHLKEKNELLARINLLRSEITELKSPVFDLGNTVRAGLLQSEISQLEMHLDSFLGVKNLA